MPLGQNLRPDFSVMRGKHVLIALSGGADSVALCHLLAQARNDGMLTLSAAHMDHAIRQDSAEDALFCGLLCQRLSIPFYKTRIDVPSLAMISGEGLETIARRLRFEWLREVRGRIGADCIALAHHMDDQAETVLMHLLRGTGPEGIIGMRSQADDLFRPLLAYRKRDLVQYLRVIDESWREDSTNAVDDTPRNALRLHVIPELEKSYPQATSAIARYAHSADIENDFVAQCTEAFLNKNLTHGAYGKHLNLPQDTEPAILRRAIRAICGKSLSWERLNAIAALCEKTHGCTEISATLFVERGHHGIYFLPKQAVSTPPEELTLEGITHLKGICDIFAKNAPPVPIRDDPKRQVLRRDALAGAILRTRRAGDRIRPLGSGEKLLSDYFTDKKLDRPLRDYVPLVAVDQDILWVVGMGISENARIRSNAETAIQLELIDMPNINE